MRDELFWLRYTLGITAHEADNMPAWELHILLDRIDTHLPHILYGVHAVEAERNAPERVSDAAMLPGMQISGSGG